MSSYEDNNRNRKYLHREKEWKAAPANQKDKSGKNLSRSKIAQMTIKLLTNPEQTALTFCL